VSTPDYEAMLFASADYGFDLLLSMFRERVAAGEHPTTPEISAKVSEYLRTTALMAAQEGYTDEPVGDVFGGYAIIHCATAIQRLIAT
jgi:hypothetical protein